MAKSRSGRRTKYKKGDKVRLFAPNVPWEKRIKAEVRAPVQKYIVMLEDGSRREVYSYELDPDED